MPSDRPVLLVLSLRGGLNALFGIGLMAGVLWGELQGFQRGGLYALADGVLGIALGAALRGSSGRWLALLAALDGAARMLVGAVILLNPWMAREVFGNLLLFIGILGAALTLAGVGLLYVWVRRPKGVQGHALVLPAVAACLCMLLLGIALAWLPEEAMRRQVLAAYALVFGAVLLWAARRTGARVQGTPSSR